MWRVLRPHFCVISAHVLEFGLATLVGVVGKLGRPAPLPRDRAGEVEEPDGARDDEDDDRRDEELTHAWVVPDAGCE